MPKPVGATCNMACEYCYYLEKKGLYPDQPRQLMSDETLEAFVKQYIQAQTLGEIVFTWHGGEAMMRPVSFYRKALELQRKYARGRTVVNAFQTNGTLITDEWCRFFKENNFLVGVSIDGPQEFHDEFRRMRGGAPSWHRVMAGIRKLREHGVEWNAMAVVNDFNGDYPVDFYQFFKDLECKYIQFTPVVERFRPEGGLSSRTDAGEVTDFSVSPEQWGEFLVGVFDQWVRHDVGDTFVQIFDATLANWVGATPGVCTMARECGHASALEWNGDLYSCDHFVFPDYKLGNIHDDTIINMMMSERQKAFGRIKSDGLPTQCRECKWRDKCNGECPRNRFALTADGEPGLNYLCRGYRRYFEHVAPYMDFMAAELKAERAPANVMQHFFGPRKKH